MFRLCQNYLHATEQISSDVIAVNCFKHNNWVQIQKKSFYTSPAAAHNDDDDDHSQAKIFFSDVGPTIYFEFHLCSLGQHMFIRNQKGPMHMPEAYKVLPRVARNCPKHPAVIIQFRSEANREFHNEL